MINNPIITRQGGGDEPIYGKVVLSEEARSISIPVTRKCSKCVLFPISIDGRTLTDMETDIYGVGRQILATNLPIATMVVSGNPWYYVGGYIRYLAAKSTVDFRNISLKDDTAGTLITFNDSSISIEPAVPSNEVYYFPKGTYGYVAW